MNVPIGYRGRRRAPDGAALAGVLLAALLGVLAAACIGACRAGAHWFQ